MRTNGKINYIFCLLIGALSCAPAPIPHSSLSIVPSASPLVLATPSPRPTLLLTQAEVAILLKEFLRSQKLELKALDHRHKYELKQLRSSQDSRLKEWQKTENEARHQYFEKHTKGAERRAYIQNFFERREALNRLIAEERTRRVKEQGARIEAIQTDQGWKLKNFKNSLDKKISPPAELWPQSGH